ncbi:hypothetical protein C8A00DRAFT_35109 [Chaetomidium leptoderma]|uniref:Uncharacterized protein n=1 Tax=Chaetomidium leptoderma TaxID=669021 RepID=A0AAN6ZVV8_9PEZI|nr:hypothetical protein C8A00DRAFT_35109 [Chaetomidium leptoderma]
MSQPSRPRTPVFRFGESRNPAPTFTVADGWLFESNSAPRRSSAASGRHLSPPSRPGRGIAPRARSSSPQYRFGDSSNHPFTFGDGWVETSPSAFGRLGEELRDALPTTEPLLRPSSASATPTAHQSLFLPTQVNNGGPNGTNTGDNPGPPVFAFGQQQQQQPRDFSLRLLHNATPLPSREPSPQPAETSAALVVPRPRHLRNRDSDVSDVSMVSDLDDGPTTPYDVRTEAAPAHRFFTAEFQSALRAGLGVARDTLAAAEALDSFVEDGGEDLEKLLDDANELCAFEGSDIKTIAVLGDSGEGKSSLINALLGFHGIAKTGDIGSACTSVVTEYRQKTREHTAPITIEVEHLRASAIEEVVHELLWNYRQLYLPGVADHHSSVDNLQHQRESAQAWSALEAAFGHQPEFGEGMLRDMSSEDALERLTAQLVEWSREIEWPESAVDGLWRSTADSAEECVEKTSVFMQNQYWPFTKIIRIYLNAQVLKTGGVLADLPGLQDTNLARVRATHDYLMRCNHIFIVTKISRAVTDQSLQSSLFSVVSNHVPMEWEDSAAQTLKIAVVCTRTEEINIEAARREFCGPGKPIRASVMQDLDAQIDDAKATGNRTLKKTLKQQRNLHLINARSAHVTAGLQRAYAAKAPGGRLDVFCVSNAWYAKHSRKGTNTELIRASGIPALRRFCYGITADAQLREARHFLQAGVFGLVNSLELWVGGRLEGVQGVSLRGDGGGDGGRRVWEVVEGLQDNRHSAWETKAYEEAQPWGKWHWTQYAAFCRNNGEHSTRKLNENWNAKIVWKLRAELNYEWDIVEEEIDAVFDELRAALAGQFDTLRAAVSVVASMPSELRTQLLAGIGARIEGCQYELARARERFARDVKLLRRYVSESSHGSYIVDAMIPTYRAANAESGTGKKERQINIVEGRITDGVLFPSAAIVLRERMDTLLDKRKAQLSEILAQVVEGIKTDIGFVLTSQSHMRTPQHDAGVAADEGRLREVLETLKMLKVRAEDVRRAAAE